MESNKFEFEFKKKRSLGEIMEQTGYKEVSAIEDLYLSSEEIKQAKDFINDEIQKRFFIAERPDGKQAKVIIFEGKKTFNGHIFSPFGYKGQSECNDWSDHELEGSLIDAKERNENGNPLEKNKK